ncbi:MAG: disulfide bond formation protein B [Alphaproteobacteria bacterium]|nr:disulfide bond formation protein B [Alphaproteobacteria bacterium]
MSRVLSLIEKVLAFPLAAKLLVLFNIGALLFALTMEYGFGARPCILCLWQRVPYASVAALSVLALLWKPYGRKTMGILSLCAFIYFAGSGVAFFHTGVERHWWKGTDSCEAAQDLKGLSAEEIRQALLAIEEPRCDVIPWTLFGLSMANYNVMALFGLSMGTALVAVRLRRKDIL